MNELECINTNPWTGQTNLTIGGDNLTLALEGLEAPSEVDARFPQYADVYETKKAIVDEHLDPLARCTNPDVNYLEYIRKGEREYVRVTYDDGYTRNINVSMDSYAAMVRDVYAQM